MTVALRATGKHDIGHRLHQQQKTLSVDRAGKVVAGQPCSRMTAVLSVLQAFSMLGTDCINDSRHYLGCHGGKVAVEQKH